jgi:hypothetical protein
MIGDGPIKLTVDALEVSLNQVISSNGSRQILILDKNRELHVTSVLNYSLKKIGALYGTFFKLPF